MFIQFLKQESKGKVSKKKAVVNIGRQPGGKVWVVGKDVHINEDGCLLPKEERTFTWLDSLIEEGMKNISLKEVVPNVCTPLTPSVLHEVITSLKAIMKHNFSSSLLVVAGGIVALHYSSIIQLSGCPTIVAFGPSETGKTTAIRVALAISGVVS